MKVIHLISGGDSGGAKTHVFSLLQGLNQTIQADMICFTDGPFAQQAKDLGIHVEVFDEYNIFKTLSRLKKHIQLGQYNLIHCHGARANLMGTLLCRICDLPVVTTVHSDPDLDYLGRFFGRLFFGTLNNWALRRLPYHIGVTDTMTDLLIDRGIVRSNFFSIYNGIQFDPVDPPKNRTDYLKSLGARIENDSVVVGIAARLNPVKDIATLIRGFAAAWTKCPRLRLIIAGDGEERSMLENLAKDLGVDSYVTFAGWINGNMDPFYGSLDINVLSSLSETFPYALTDGTRFRLATVATAVGGIPSLIDHSVNGYLFPPRDWSALGEHLATLGNDDALRITFGLRLYEKASTQFSIEKTIDTQLSIYRKILDDWHQRTNAQRRGAVVCGAYGRGNSGDESILRAIIAELRSIDPEMPICVMTRQPCQTRKKCRVEAIYTFNPIAYRKKMATSKLFVNGGGSLIQDVTSRRSLWFYLSTLSTAHKLGCRVMMYGCGIGPLRHQFDCAISSKIINNNVDVITLRDQNSLDELRAIKVTRPRIQLAADPTVSLPPTADDIAVSMLRSVGLNPGSEERYLGISLRPWPGFNDKASMIADTVEQVCRTHDLTPVFISIEPQQDEKAAMQVAQKLTIPYAILSDHTKTEQTIGLFSQMDVVLSMRLHALVFSAVHGVPLVGIVYDPKVSAFLDYVGQDLYTPLDELTSAQLKGHLEAAVSRIDDRKLLEEQAAKLLELERGNVLCAQELLKGDFQ